MKHRGKCIECGTPEQRSNEQIDSLVEFLKNNAHTLVSHNLTQEQFYSRLRAALDAYGRDGDGGLGEQLRDPEQCSEAATLDELAIARICARYWLAVARKRNEIIKRAAAQIESSQ